MNKKCIEINPSLPIDSTTYDYSIKQFLKPLSYNGWETETLSWKKTAYISANLSAEMPMLRLKGPDAVRLLNENTVDNFTKMKVGRGRHTIFCSEKGNIVAHGITLRFSEDEFGCYALQPCLPLIANSGKYDVEPIELKIHDFIYQVAGPKSLEILEQAVQEDLHDIKFFGFRNSKIAGHTVRIVRVGMAGTLAYEVHGPLEIAHQVYNVIISAGESFGLEKLGYTSYMCNHTENGFPQGGYHFTPAWAEHKLISESMADQIRAGAANPLVIKANGSLSDNIEDYYRNPFELGWGSSVKFDHDFVGKEALQKIAAGPHKQVVTLLWNHEDILKVFSSRYNVDEEPYKLIEFPLNLRDNPSGSFQCKILDESDKVVGKSSIPVYTLYYKNTISLCIVDPYFAEIGKDVVVVWGGKNDRKINIRARVERFPYLDLPTNQSYDIESIPRFKK